MFKLGVKEGIDLLEDMDRIVESDESILISIPEVYEKYGSNRIDNFLYQISIDGNHYQEFLRTKASKIPEISNFSVRVEDSQLKLTHKSSKEQSTFLRGVVVRIWYKKKAFAVDKESIVGRLEKIPGEIDELKKEIELARSVLERPVTKTLKDNYANRNLSSRLDVFREAFAEMRSNWSKNSPKLRRKELYLVLKILTCPMSDLLESYEDVDHRFNSKVNRCLKDVEQLQKWMEWYKSSYPTIEEDIEKVEKYLSEIGYEKVKSTY